MIPAVHAISYVFFFFFFCSTHLGSLNETERGVVTGIETGIENVTTEMTESVIETEVTGTGRAIAVMTVTG